MLPCSKTHNVCLLPFLFFFFGGGHCLVSGLKPDGRSVCNALHVPAERRQERPQSCSGQSGAVAQEALGGHCPHPPLGPPGPVTLPAPTGTHWALHGFRVSCAWGSWAEAWWGGEGTLSSPAPTPAALGSHPSTSAPGATWSGDPPSAHGDPSGPAWVQSVAHSGRWGCGPGVGGHPELSCTCPRG